MKFILIDPATHDNMSPLGSPIVLQRKGSVYGANVPMITELVNDSNVQFLGKRKFLLIISRYINHLILSTRDM